MAQLKFSDFKTECEKAFREYQQLHPEYYDCRIYERLPHDISANILKRDAVQRWWFMFAYQHNCYIVMSCDPSNNFCEFYSDYIEELGDWGGGETFRAYLNNFMIGSDYQMSIANIPIYIRMLQNFPTTRYTNKMFVVDSNGTEAWKNGDDPLECEHDECSLVQFINSVKKAKKEPDPEWRGMQLEAHLKGASERIDYLVKF